MCVTSLANGTPEMRASDQQYQKQQTHDLTAFRGILLAGGASALFWLSVLAAVWALR
jgi:hypothetical protein